VTISTETRLSQVVACLRTSQPMPPPQGQAGDAGVRDLSPGHHQAVKLRLAIEIGTCT
jgi:hypothetical protein